ncbi:MAG TPA: methylmalonyl-CoA decarboxylase [Terriglobales bacterium]|nr:methylmalonyl-CoA decarboxylase [Terriglobales bacterium]
MPLALKKIEGALGTIMLNNPEKRNCLSAALIREVCEALDGFEAAGVRVAILRAQPGVRVWSAGYDVNELPHPGRDPLPYAAPFGHLLRRVQRFPGPIIAMIEGGVWGGACDLALTCDILIGTDTASFAVTPAKIGIPYNASGMIHFINVIGLNKAKEMFFTAAPITANDALKAGILNHLVPASELENFTRTIAERILQNAPLAVKAFKRQFTLLSKGHSIDAETAEHIQSYRRIVYDSEDYGEGIRAFHEKRPPRFKGK